jgi:tetratricopeptide (TPR) repeat protein
VTCQRAIALWQTALTTYQQSHQSANAAIVLENLARVYQQVGQTEQAIAQWEQAIALYQQMGDQAQVARMLTEQAQAYSQLGQYRQAIALLCHVPGEETCIPGSAVAIAQTVGDRATEAAALGSLGEAYCLKGDYDRAMQYLQDSLAIAREMESPILVSALNSLGNTAVSLAQVNYRRASLAEETEGADSAWVTLSDTNRFRQTGLQYDEQALIYFQEGLTVAEQYQDAVNQLRSLLGAVAPAYRTGKATMAASHVQTAQDLLMQLPSSQDKVYTAIDLAHLLDPIPSMV